MINFIKTVFFCILVLLLSSSYLLDVKQEIPYGDMLSNVYSPKIIHRTSDVILTVNFDYWNTAIYRFEGSAFELYKKVYDFRIVGSGDFDSDGKLDIMGISVSDSRSIVLYEQNDDSKIYTNETWKMTLPSHAELHCFGVSNLIKGDGKDRMYAAPDTSTQPSSPLRWWYLECTGDNTYEISYIDTSSVNTYALDFGYLDEDTLLDVIGGKGGVIWEAKDSANDSFHNLGFSYKFGYWNWYNKIIGDIDKDGHRELITGGIYNDTDNYVEWITGIIECIGDNNYDTVWTHIIRKEYGSWNTEAYGSGAAVGDVDNDNEKELILCAGPIIEIFKSVSNDSFEMVWSMDNDTFAGSSVIAYDFNGNGIDEIIWSGSMWNYPDISMMKTYIIEWRRLWSQDSIFFSNSESGDTLYRYMWITNRGNTSLNIDSVGFDSKEFKQDTGITYPLTLDSNDSIGIRCSFYSDSEGVYGGKTYVYGDKSRYEIDMMGGSRIKCLIDSIVGYDGGTVGAGIDEDDYVIVYFAGATNRTDIDTSDIDNILKLSSGHTWGDVESADWLFRLNGHDRLRVTLSTASGVPDISVGDTIYPDSITIRELLMDVPCHDATVIQGSFGPSGINSQTEGAAYDLSFKGLNLGSSILEYTTYTKDTRVDLYDITGRNVFTQKSSHTGSNTISLSSLRSGIYFIRLTTSKESISKSIIRLF